MKEDDDCDDNDSQAPAQFLETLSPFFKVFFVVVVVVVVVLFFSTVTVTTQSIL